MTQRPLAIVAGAGAGLGRALLRKFAAEGMLTVGLSRSAAQADDPGLRDCDLRACDLSDAQAVRELLLPLLAQHGAPRIVVHNPAHLIIRDFLETSTEDFAACWQAMVLSCAVLGQTVLPAMAAAGGGAFIVSGATASIRGGARFAAFASAKFALRGLAQSLARGFQPAGVHVVHTILDGIIDSPASRERHRLAPERMMNPDDLAEVYWQLAQQPASAWTHEIDLRPRSESF